MDVYRIHDWVYYLGFVVLGSLMSNKAAGIPWAVLLVCALALAFIYALNDFTDHRRKNLFFILPLLLLTVCKDCISLKQSIPLIIFLALQILYSVKPFRLKKFPVIGTLCCIFAFPQFFLIGYFDTAVFDLRAFWTVSLLFLLSGVIQLIHEIDDMEEDAFAGIRTSAVFYGRKVIGRVCMVLLLLGIGASFCIYTLQIIDMITFFALVIFQLHIFKEIFFKGITYKTRFRFRIWSFLSGWIWIISSIL